MEIKVITQVFESAISYLKDTIKTTLNVKG